ncbi:putative Nuclear pore complex protein [Paratrimastix pyriformis]|uniref:Nuclear pore complex protein n=1 Tax=Paratrimastix pyriformis TaxID=342808 RepID=A0ABQ8UQW8_9EUKA|nr:putative Nuclear pore complex protein [Paratrimastix pyriformis]
MDRAQRNTWLLTRTLLADSLVGPALLQTEPQSPLQPEASSPKNPLEIIAELHQRDPVVRHMELVARWLESIYFEDVRYYEEQHSWGRTLQGLLRTQGALGPIQAGPFSRHPASLDPDGPLRHLEMLHSEDEASEARLHMTLWQFMRAGRLADAQELLRKSGQPWRAASLGGGAPFDTDGEKSTGNEFEGLWSDTCRVLAERGRTAAERGLYGLLAGWLEPAVPLCQSKEDFLWAALRAEIRARERAAVAPTRRGHPRLRDEPAEADGAEDAAGPEGRRTRSRTEGDVTEAGLTDGPLGFLDALDAHAAAALGAPAPALTSEGFSAAACEALFTWAEQQQQAAAAAAAKKDEIMEAFWLIQRRLALGQWGPLMDEMVALAAAQQGALSSFLVQLCLMLEQVGVPVALEPRTALLLRYIGHLTATKTGFDPMGLVQWILDNQPKPPQAPARSGLAGGLSEAELAYVGALEWLTFDQAPAARLAALLHANAMARHFTVLHNLDAVRMIYDERLPAGTIAMIRSRWSEGTPSLIERNAIKECLSLRAHVHVHDLYAGWCKLRQEQPLPPVLPPVEDPLTQDMLTKQAQARYQDALRAWEAQKQQATSQLTASLQAILEFEGGWLVDQDPSAAPATLPEPAHHDHAAQRQAELEALRRLCLPPVLFLLHRVCHETGLDAAFLEVAVLVADQSRGLAKVLSRDETRRLLGLLARSATALLRA